jgi:hypothetical protein
MGYRDFFSRGTGSSNPSPSSGESYRPHAGRRRATPPRDGKRVALSPRARIAGVQRGFAPILTSSAATTSCRNVGVEDGVVGGANSNRAGSCTYVAPVSTAPQVGAHDQAPALSSPKQHDGRSCGIELGDSWSGINLTGRSRDLDMAVVNQTPRQGRVARSGSSVAHTDDSRDQHRGSPDTVEGNRRKYDRRADLPG